MSSGPSQITTIDHNAVDAADTTWAAPELVGDARIGCVKIPDGEQGFVIGRRARRAQLVIPDAMVSRAHCRVFRRANQTFVEDLDSKHGTLHNGALLCGAVALRHGDVLHVGPAQLKFHCYRDLIAESNGVNVEAEPHLPAVPSSHDAPPDPDGTTCVPPPIPAEAALMPASGGSAVSSDPTASQQTSSRAFPAIAATAMTIVGTLGYCVWCLWKLQLHTGV